jgi:hypothetical protein
MRRMSWQNLSKKRGSAIDLSARARLGSAALEERHTLGAPLRALMQEMNVKQINISANIHRSCQLLDEAVTLMKQLGALAVEPAADPMMVAGLLPCV